MSSAAALPQAASAATAGSESLPPAFVQRLQDVLKDPAQFTFSGEVRERHSKDEGLGLQQQPPAAVVWPR